jgi:hypothetical protein
MLADLRPPGSPSQSYGRQAPDPQAGEGHGRLLCLPAHRGGAVPAGPPSALQQDVLQGCLLSAVRAGLTTAAVSRRDGSLPNGTQGRLTHRRHGGAVKAVEDMKVDAPLRAPPPGG